MRNSCIIVWVSAVDPAGQFTGGWAKACLSFQLVPNFFVHAFNGTLHFFAIGLQEQKLIERCNQFFFDNITVIKKANGERIFFLYSLDKLVQEFPGFHKQ
mmetsp:Transcript_14089/g.36155  ORF Transcript_14089/g.36155 Transcript_14089/m.36155 type:complete len:100 (+) Transcript_14089:178-477(+)